MYDLVRLAPELICAGFGMVIMVLDPLVSRAHKIWMARLALAGALLALVSFYWAGDMPGTAYSGVFIVDHFSIFLRVLIYAVVLLAVLGSSDYLEREGIQMGEYYALLLFAAVGMGIMAGANELVTAFVGLEISSIASYVLAGFRRNVLKSNEAAMKYFLLGSFATAFFLYGVAMVYGATATTNLQALAEALPQSRSLMVLGMGMLFVGLAFKVASVPFQIWTPDAYEGAPTPVTALFSSGPKAAAFALLVRIFFTAFGGAEWNGLWFWAIYISAVLTMFTGNLAALVQSNVKRMLAYSSIAHAGYVLVAIAARSEHGIAAVLFYLVTYSLVKMGAFTILAHIGDAGEKRLDLADYAGLGWKRPVAAAFLALFLLSLLGLPVTAGFLGKLYVFNAALGAAKAAPPAIEGTVAQQSVLSAALVWLAVLLAINSVIAAYYYLRVIVAMYFNESASEWKPAPMPLAVGLVVFLAAVGTIYFGLFPNEIMHYAFLGANAIR
jgi:NADH-quinone oxidoreductase subunit N